VGSSNTTLPTDSKASNTFLHASLLRWDGHRKRSWLPEKMHIRM
jgi:hypothetical protein